MPSPASRTGAGPTDAIRNLAAALARDPFTEKLLVAPSYRVGRQWLDQVALFAGGVTNVHTTTFRRLVRDLAEPELRRQGLRAATPAENTVLVGRAMADLRRAKLWEGYFTSLPDSLELAETLAAALDELESAGVADKRIAAAVAHPGKGAELTELARLCRRDKRRLGLAGQGHVLAAALTRAREYGAVAPRLVAPASIVGDLTGMQKRIWQAWPADNKEVVPETTRPDPAGWSFFRADQTINEVREVFRRIQERAIPLDRVELVSLDAAAYDPAVVAVALETFGGRPEDLPLTLHLGLPAWHSRPVRLIAAWLEWLELGTRPEDLARMVESGLLGEGWRRAAPSVSGDAIAGRLRQLPLHGDAASYQERLRADDNGDLRPALVWLADLLRRIQPPPERSPAERNPALLDAAAGLAALRGPHDGKLDAYAAVALSDLVAEWRPHAAWSGFDAWSWLNRETSALRVMGLGPMPGRLHVGDIFNGGQAGRPHLFVLGLDDSRFPGQVRQDPVLLDAERTGLSSILPLSGQRRRQRENALSRLLARSGGEVSLSHAARDAGRGRELFPAAQFTAWAEEAGQATASANILPAPAAASAAALRRRDDWLAVLLPRPGGVIAADALKREFPFLAQGEKALRARAGDLFGEYDGMVPEAGRLRFPANGDWCLSPTDLERFAACPRDFFYRNVLEVKPPDRFEPRAGGWLEGNERGNLLHDLFQDFLAGREGESIEPVTLERAEAELFAMLEKAVRRYRKKFPPRDELAYAREADELREACAIFLATERQRQQWGKPLYLEIAMGSDREPVTPWDRGEPVEVMVADNRRLRLKGRIDRVDRLHDGSGLVILDYKTGRSDKYDPGDPLRQGRHLQPLLYAHMLAQSRADAGRPEAVRGFSYFFPMPRDEGKTVSFPASVLGREQLAVVEQLLQLLEAGYFPLSTAAEDIRFSDYAEVHAAGGDTCDAARRKVLNPATTLLSIWARLREM